MMHDSSDLLSPDAGHVLRAGSSEPERATLSMPPRVKDVADTRREALRADVHEAMALRQSYPSHTLEIGCGHGHFLVAYAAAHRDQACFGIDFSRIRIQRAHRKVTAARLENASFLHGSADDFLAVLEPAVRFRRVFVLFPDPWPKRRHQKNRLINASFLSTLAGVTEPGAELFFRTDFFDYFSATERAFRAHANWEMQDGGGLWAFEHPTVFQAKASLHYSCVAVRIGPATG